MTKKEKIEYASLAGIVVATAAVLYFFLFKPQAAQPSNPDAGFVTGTPIPIGAPSAAPAGFGAGAVGGTGTGASAGTSPVASAPALPGGLLPNGTALKTSILTDPTFTSLVPPVYPQVTVGDVGNPDPFAPLSTPTTSSQPGK